MEAPAELNHMPPKSNTMKTTMMFLIVSPPSKYLLISIYAILDKDVWRAGVAPGNSDKCLNISFSVVFLADKRCIVRSKILPPAVLPCRFVLMVTKRENNSGREGGSHT